MSNSRTDEPVAPADRRVFVQDALAKARKSVALARVVLAAAERIVAVTETMHSANIPDLGGLRTALIELGLARRALDAGLNDSMEIADRVLAAFGARTRHLLG